RHVVAAVQADHRVGRLHFVGAVRAARRDANLLDAVGLAGVLLLGGPEFLLDLRRGHARVDRPLLRHGDDAAAALAADLLAREIVGHFGLFLTVGARYDNGAGHR